uniref:C-type lectin domain-containing protein n=1 Tax=Stegastes partitus TaxID=144197 RepID=A0A3B5AX37_9TELE
VLALFFFICAFLYLCLHHVFFFLSSMCVSLCVLLLTKNWTEAQDYCRQHHTDLSFINSQSDIAKLRRAADGNLHEGWIGLERDPNNETVWKWSGGGHITYENWKKNQPNNHRGSQKIGIMLVNGKWNDLKGVTASSFYSSHKQALHIQTTCKV